MEPIIFMFCLTLHNMEEALWLTEWKRKVFPHSKKAPNQKHFLFALLGITALGYLAAGMSALFPDNQYLELIFVGFVGAMLINAFVPHLLMLIKYKKYCPGVLTGCFLLIPFNAIILYNAANTYLKISEIIIATLIVGVILLAAISFFTWLANLSVSE